MINQNEKPQAYIDGFIEFYGFKFKVTPDVLIPRFETEQLVKEAITFAKSYKEDVRVIDIGTGSGCIAIILAKLLPEATVLAVDISDKALEVAKENANTIGANVNFVQNDLLSNFRDTADIIVANLPYIPTKNIATLDESVKNFEPVLALDGGPDGFDLYRKLFGQIVENNIDPKIILAEIDDDHREIALKEAAEYFPTATIKVKKDVSNFDRVLEIKF
jgi:release factor glutamine methyltransferase